jgi:hypothetical protein
VLARTCLEGAEAARVLRKFHPHGRLLRYPRELWIGPRRELRKAAYPSA